MPENKMLENVDLTNCDREPIHLLGKVQSFGFLLAVNAQWVITHVSENVFDFCGHSASALLNRHASVILSSETIHTVRNRMQFLRPKRGVEVIYGVPLNGCEGLFDLSVHINGDLIFLELENADEIEGLVADFSNVRTAIDQMSELSTSAQILKQSVRFLRMMTGYDRVMLYRFDHDGTGEVVAEARKHDMEPFLNLRYPASDIPKQARALFVENPIRMIADLDDQGSPVIAANANDGDLPVDLSGSRLRTVSPIHVEYLRNMGVGASMSISIVVRGVLWGLFACHHNSAHLPNVRQRNAALLFGQMLSLMIQTRLDEEERANDDQVSALTSDISRNIASGADAIDVLISSADAFSGLLNADGYAVVQDQKVIAGGHCPENSDVLAICEKLNALSGNEVFSTHHLGKFIESANSFLDRAAGFLSIPISRSPRDYILFFRKEHLREVNWAGNPEKPVTVGANGARLTPRKSFEAWAETVRGQSVQWLAKDIRTAVHLRIMLLEVVLRLTDEAGRERQAAAERQELLIAELNHRVRNILGLVRGLISQSSSGEDTTASFVQKLDSRVQALARAHDQITRENWAPAPFRRLIETEAESYLLDKKDRVLISGPEILLMPQAYSSMALVMHEMLTNSAKYGAVSDRNGVVEISMSVESGGSLHVSWVEKDGPKVKPPSRRGFGSTIVERTVPFELGGEVDIRYDPDGVKAKFVIPSNHFQARGIKLGAALASKSSSRDKVKMPQCVLVVEDNLIIALEAEDIFEKLGSAEITVVATEKAAFNALDSAKEKFAFALLDINLGSGTSFDIARQLQDLEIPFVFATGYGDGARMPDDLARERKISKPYDTDAILALFE